MYNYCKGRLIAISRTIRENEHLLFSIFLSPITPNSGLAGVCTKEAKEGREENSKDAINKYLFRNCFNFILISIF